MAPSAVVDTCLEESDFMISPMKWKSGEPACEVELSAAAIAAILRLADAAHPDEAGAALYGRYSDDGWLARIEGIAPVSSDSARGKFYFRRGVAGLATFFRRLFRRTQGESYYVGEFHSHPGGSPTPSSQDDQAQFAIAANHASQCGTPVLLIVGGTPTAREFGVFLHTREGHRLDLQAQAGPPLL